VTLRAYRANGARAARTARGYTETAVWEVLGLDTVPDAEWMHAACHADGLPPPGDPHPIEEGVVVISLTPERLSADHARVSIQYGIPTDESATPESDPGSIAIAASAQPEIVTSDRYGEPITVTWRTTTTDENGDEIEFDDTKGVELEVMRPQLVVRFTRLEAEDPIDKALGFLGRVNRRAIWKGGARDWLCTDLSGETDDRGASYRVSYEFTSAPGGIVERRNALGLVVGPRGGGWDQEVVYIDDETGAPPDNLEPGLGIKVIRVYPEADFSDLELPDLA
jgi:hypothetical protein